MTETMFDKIWSAHVVVARDDGASLLWIDRHLVHDGSFHAFGMLDHAARPLRRPDLTLVCGDAIAAFEAAERAGRAWAVPDAG